MPQYYEGDPNAKIAFIGEAPGPDEESYGRPFVGKPAKLLFQLCEQVGIIRSECYFDNVFQQAPAKGDLTPWLDLSKKFVIESRFFRDSVEQLAIRLDNVTANVLVAIGPSALYALTGLKAITKRRGSILEGTGPFAGRKVIPIINPGIAFKEFLFTRLISMDLRRVVDQSFFPEIKLLPRNLLTEPGLAEVLAFVAECKARQFASFDIEVSNREVSHFSLAYSGTDSMSIPFKHSGDNYYNPPQEAQIWHALTMLLQDPEVRKVGQNLAFDSTFLYRRLGIRVHPMDDTMIAQAIIFPDFPKGLDFIQSIYCEGEPYYKDDGKEWFRYAEGEAAFRRYSAMDAAIVAEAWPRMERDLHNTGNWDTYVRQAALLEPLVFIGEHGIRMDTEGMKAASIECDREITKLQEELFQLTGEPINWNSPPQLKNYFYVKLGLPPYTKMGSITTDDKALKRIAAKGYREAEIVLELRRLKKLDGTYYTMLLDDDKRLRCSYNPVGTKQGRISSSKTIFGTGGNLQNQPAVMKALMLADPGFVMIAHDLSQAENRVVAYDAGEFKMIEAFENGVDIHKLTASMIYNVPINEVTKDQRDWGKRANHGLNYDLSAGLFSMLYQVDEMQATFLVESYHRIYPGIRRWHRIIVKELNQTRTLYNLFGRKRVFLDRWNRDLWKEAYSYIPQSTVAELMNQNGVRFVYERQDLFPEVHLLNTVHDSLIYQVPLSVGTDRMTEIISLVKKNLELPLTARGRSFSIPVDTKIGFTLDEAKMLELKAKDTKDPAQVSQRIGDFLRASST